MFKGLFCIILVIMSFSFVYSADVFIFSEVDNKTTYFTYYINFSEDENYKSFSFEKPRNSEIIYSVKESGGNIEYNSAGDFYIIKPEETAGEMFEIKFKTDYISQRIVDEGVFSVYMNFNIPIERMRFELDFMSDFGNTNLFFPRNYEISDSGNLIWEMDVVNGETFFLVEFEKFEGNNLQENSSSFFNIIYFYYALVLLLIVIILFLVIYMVFKNKFLPLEYLKFKKNNEKEDSSKINENKNFEDSVNVSYDVQVENVELDDKRCEDIDIKNEKKERIDFDFEDAINKYLTENEREVVKVVKNNEGISQYDILNYIPSLTKSNLSKIITKLNSKNFLNRIKVGKVNKIYLGSKLDNKEE